MDEEKKILTIISDHLGVPLKDLSLNSHLRSDLNAQSLEIADLIKVLETEFEVHFTSEDVKSLHTVRDIVDLVRIS